MIVATLVCSMQSCDKTWNTDVELLAINATDVNCDIKVTYSNLADKSDIYSHLQGRNEAVIDRYVNISFPGYGAAAMTINISDNAKDVSVALLNRNTQAERELYDRFVTEEVISKSKSYVTIRVVLTINDELLSLME